MASTECSILKFFEQFLDGETKQQSPRWAGITEINNILNNLANNINNMKGATKTNLNNQYTDIGNARTNFLNLMHSIGNNFFDSSGGVVTDNYKADYLKPDNPPSGYDYSFTNSGSTYLVKGRYVLDLVKNFGRYKSNDNTYYPEGSVLYFWNEEYLKLSEEADKQLDNANQGFNNILDTSSGDIINNLNDGKATLNDLRGAFNDIKSQIADVIVDNYETIDENGKLGFKMVFGVLGLINIAIAAFMFLICFFSGKLCAKSCCCCRCIFKCAVHLLWNILALLMIITFLVGFFVALIGQIGSDAMSVISFVISSDNIGNNGDNILVDALGDDVKGYINRCVNGDGKIEEQLGLGEDDINSFDQIYKAEDVLAQAKKNFENVQYLTYDKFRTQIIKRGTLEEIPNLVLVDNPASNNVLQYLNYKTLLEEMNNAIQSQSLSLERWSISSSDSIQCGTGNNDDGLSFTEEHIFNPTKCQPYYRDWIQSLDTSSNTNFKEVQDRAKILTDILLLVDNAKADPSDSEIESGLPNEPTDFLGKLNYLKLIYGRYIEQYETTLEAFESAISTITRELKTFTGKDNGLFSFIKCTFIGTNLKIILKYLKSALGGDVKTVGICLLVVGCSLALSISATILMIVIINIDIENKKKNNGNDQVQLDSQGRLIQYKS